MGKTAKKNEVKQAEERGLEEKIIDMIADRLETGEKFPPEKQLMEELGVSRTSLREALSVFEASGIILTQQGSGRYVQMPDVSTQITDTWSIVLRAKPTMLLDLLEIRSILELNCLQKAMEQSTVDQLKQLKEQVLQMEEKAERKEDFVEEDREFHRILFSSLGNVLLQQLLTAFWDVYDRSKIDTHHGDLMQVANQHHQMLNAFAKQDIDTLTKLTKDQFADARYRIMVSLMK